MTSTAGIQTMNDVANIANGDSIKLLRTDPLHFDENGTTGPLGDTTTSSFQDQLLKALGSVDQDQQYASQLNQQVIVDPNSVDPQDVTIAMAKANLSLSIAQTVLSRLVQGWKDIINVR